MPNIDPMARYLRTPEAARVLSLSPRTLEKHRTYGTGPTYHKLGGRVVYDIEDIKTWADRGTRNSTSDPGRGIVYPAKPIKPKLPPLPHRSTTRDAPEEEPRP